MKDIGCSGKVEEQNERSRRISAVDVTDAVKVVCFVSQTVAQQGSRQKSYQRHGGLTAIRETMASRSCLTSKVFLLTCLTLCGRPDV